MQTLALEEPVDVLALASATTRETVRDHVDQLIEMLAELGGAE